MKNFKIFLLAAAVCGLAGCSESENNHPMLKKAAQSKRMGEFRNAELCYKKYLAKNPEAGRIHLELAQLYDEELEDYLLAIYHYKEYIRLAGDKENADIRAVKGFIERCEQRYMNKNKSVKKVLLTDEQELERMAAAYKKRLADEQKAMELEIARLKKEAEEAKQKEPAQAAEAEKTAAPEVPQELAQNNNADSPVAEVLMPDSGIAVDTVSKKEDNKSEKITSDSGIAEVSEKISEDSRIVEAVPPEKKEVTAEKKQENTVKKAEKAEKEEFPPMKNAAAEKVNAAPKDREYKIQKGDTFTHVSRKFYGSIRYYRQLMEYNKISNPNALRIGKIIKIPPLEVLKGEK